MSLTRLADRLLDGLLTRGRAAAGCDLNSYQCIGGNLYRFDTCGRTLMCSNCC
ncbi:hypothetical protein LX16_1079 [Stackebrandtia albiflava]|uniref:Uncharacterized protein n=1 Tax=Stackebrandtia albiflava TaxID=406432 RepID=A0A562VBX5_9ACTN|nr:hypothetical protein [Stackebrandtia albiflava]TWJ15376.1 hypothetical protein LX16_1079 [Stackebrandtia albiflava]